MVDRFNLWVEHASDTSLRLAALGGLLAALALVWLGAIWPSLFTVVAIVALASPFIFLAGIVRPALLREWRGIRGYAILCVVLSAACWIVEVAWLAHVLR